MAAPTKKRMSVGMFMLLITVGMVVLILIIASVFPGRPTETVSTVAIPKTGNKTHNMIVDFSEPKRLLLFSKFLEEEKCIANRAFYMGSAKDNMAFWSVACDNGKSYEISIEANETGSTKILPCSTLEALTNVKCFQRFEDQK